MSVMTMLLAAEDAGLGALFFGVFQGERELRRALGIPAVMQLLGAIALGWPAPTDADAEPAAGRRHRAAAARAARPASAADGPTRSSTAAAGASAEMRLVLIGLAGAAGALSRYGIGQAIGPRSFPWATLGINVVGAFVLGVVLGGPGVDRWSTTVTSIVAVGFLGAFTTFSTFAYETTSMLRGRPPGGRVRLRRAVAGPRARRLGARLRDRAGRRHLTVRAAGGRRRRSAELGAQAVGGVLRAPGRRSARQT